MTLAPFRIEHYFARHEFTAQFMLSSSDSESRSVNELLELEPDARQQMEALRLGYTEVPGAPALRKAIAAIYDGIGADNVRVFSSAEECIYVAYRALVGPQDHVIVETPHYESAAELARATGAGVSRWIRRFEDGWTHDLASLRKLVRPNTKLIYIATPSNPLGLLMPRGVLDDVLDIARDRKMVVLCDEVYRELEHDPAKRLPACCDLYDHAISIGSMSKSYGLAGLRLGWLACRDKALLAECTDYKMYTTICSSAPSEFLSALALRNRETLLSRNLDIIRRNLPILEAFFRRHSDLFDVVMADASPICFPRINMKSDVREFCDRLVAQTSVMLLPGTVYDQPQHVRIGFGRSNMPAALSKLEQFLSAETYSLSARPAASSPSFEPTG
jgi:aspartate/methionine/tyrosine aminotransferase